MLLGSGSRGWFSVVWHALKRPARTVKNAPYWTLCLGKDEHAETTIRRGTLIKDPNSALSLPSVAISRPINAESFSPISFCPGEEAHGRG